MRARNAQPKKKEHSGIDFPWPVALLIALLFLLGIFLRQPHTVTAEQRWHQQHGG
jgi:hypothetical protein